MSSAQPDSTVEPAVASGTLRRGRLGVFGIAFFVVAASAPLVGMTGAVPIAIGLGNGAAAPGAYLAVGIVLLLFAVGYSAMSQRVTNAGAFFAYVGRGLGRNAGIGSALISLVAYLGVQLAIFGFFGGLVGLLLPVLPWWAWALIAWAAVTGLSVLSVDVGAKVLGVMLVLELLALVITAVAILASGGPEGADLGASFAPQNILAGGLAGSAGIALAFAFASFIGFEATAIYGEESKEPKRVVPRATYLAVIVITVLFALVSFAMVTGMGASAVVDETFARSGDLLDPAAVLFSLADQYVGPWMVTVMSVLVVSSLFAGLLAFQNAAARYFFAMGRGGVLPGGLSRTNRRGAPWVASVTASVITGLVIIVFAIAGLDPTLNLFYWFSGVAVIAIVLVEILVSIAIIAYFAKHRDEANAFQRIVAPVLAIVGLAVGEYLLIARFGLLAGTAAEGVDPTVTPFALSPLGWVLVLLPFAVFVIGLILAAVRKTNDELLKDVIS